MTFEDMLNKAREEGRVKERKNTLREKERADRLEAELAQLKAQLSGKTVSGESTEISNPSL